MYTSAQTTMYLKDVIGEGYTLPNSSIIPDLNGVSFEDLFKQKYWLYEIGSDTVENWLQKVDNRFKIVLPFYKDTISIYTKIKDKAIEDYERTTKSKYFEKPLGTSTSALADDNVQDANVITETQQGFSEGIDYLERIGKIKDKMTNIYETLLNEFKGLFVNIQ